MERQLHTNNTNNPRIYRLSVSRHKGDRKKNVASVRVIEGKGIEGDAHFGSSKPVSLLPYESFAKLASEEFSIMPGDFAENITTEAVDFSLLKIGSRIALGETVILEIVEIGKECHESCVIQQTVGDCIMPREGVFANPVKGGILNEGDPVKIL